MKGKNNIFVIRCSPLLVLLALALPALSALCAEPVSKIKNRQNGTAADNNNSGRSSPGKPAPALAQLTIEQLEGMEKLTTKRREVIEIALKLGRDNARNHYLFGSADMSKGGFDCSGAIYFVLRKAGLKPPRTSSTQFDWILTNKTLTEIPTSVRSLDDRIFDQLTPGDLLFWSHTYDAKDGRSNGVTHVQMYLGKEKKDGRPVMIGSSDGRSYRGKRQDGYGVFDLKLPSKRSKSKFCGFGSPPGIDGEAK